MKEENKVKNPMSIKGIADYLKEYSETAKKIKAEEQVVIESVQKTASISSILKNWIQGASSVFGIEIQGIIKDKAAVIVYSGTKNTASVASASEKIVSDWIMEMVKKNSDGTRANSVALKRQYYEDLKTELLSFDLFEGAEKLEEDLKAQKAEKQAQAKAKIAKQKAAEDNEFEEAPSGEEFEDVGSDFEETPVEDFEEPTVEGEFNEEFGDEEPFD